MITPLDIENKKFSKQMMNGYSVDEVDDFLDELTIDYTKNYKEVNELRSKVDELNKSLEHAKEVLAQRLAREPTTEELAIFLETPTEKIEEALIAARRVESLDCAYDDESGNLYNCFGQEETQMTDEFLDLKNAIQNLPREEQQLIVARYYDGLTQQETSQTLGMSQVQVSRRENKILQKLKTTL